MLQIQAGKLANNCYKFTVRSSCSVRFCSDNMNERKTDELYHIGGIPVHFPCKPYPSQIAIMGRIIKGLREKQNCLLESPTGSGKSLALLCSTLAWQKVMTERIERYNDLVCQDIRDRDVLSRVLGEDLPMEDDMEMPPSPGMSTPVPAPANDATSEVPQNTAAESPQEGGFIRADDENDFKEDDLRTLKQMGPENIMPFPSQNEEPQDRPPAGVAGPRIKLMRVPKIFYGSRTHKQLYQIIRELRKTKYKNVKSAVLGSREHTCIHPIVSKSDNKADKCKELREARAMELGCRYYEGGKRIRSFDQMEKYGIQGAWDLEDLVKAGRKGHICPYYTAKTLSESAEIVFCPYNYLTDPRIREIMQISLKDHIIILDEAHNVEDSSRDAASLTLTQRELIDAKNDLEKLARENILPETCNNLAQMISSVCLWMDSYANKLKDYVEYNRSCKLFSGEEAATHFDNIDLGPKAVEEYSKSLHRLVEECQQEEESTENKSAPNNRTVQLLKGFFQGLNYLYRHNMESCHDYKVALLKSQIYGIRKDRNANKFGGWIPPSKPTMNEEFSINLWCLNPNVAFSTLGESSRCIILTSGTLSPMNSFQSELGINFPIQLEANHVIKKDQVWIGTLSSGPKNYMLTGTYKNTESLDFQDEVGQTVMEVCKVVPGGVLCFFPSYSILDKMRARWQDTLLCHHLNKIKAIIVEPKKSNQFEATIKEFYQVIEDTKENGSQQTGALLLAVCRGKVSEGLDFSNDNARAVICVGIPFPSIKDIQVDLKKKYNDHYYKQRKLLSGSEWYEIQAYRALNQALGRCIRHRYDWGALLLLDERYQRNLRNGENRYIQGLSKWIRKSLVHQPNFSLALQNIKNFSSKMVNNPPGSELAAIPIKEEIDSNAPLELLRSPSFSGMAINSEKSFNRVECMDSEVNSNILVKEKPLPIKASNASSISGCNRRRSKSPVFGSKSSLNKSTDSFTPLRNRTTTSCDINNETLDIHSPVKKKRKTFSFGRSFTLKENSNSFIVDGKNNEQEHLLNARKTESNEDLFAELDNSCVQKENSKDSTMSVNIPKESSFHVSDVEQLSMCELSEDDDFQQTPRHKKRTSKILGATNSSSKKFSKIRK